MDQSQHEVLRCSETTYDIGDVETKSKREIKEICTIWDNEQWKWDINSNSTLKVYKHKKKQIQEEHIYIL